MNVFQLLFFFVLMVPFAEIYLLLEVGGLVGAFPTILLVVASGVLGAWLLQQQGFATFRRFQQTLARGEIPAYEMIEGLLILIGGALLLTPGFISDALGLLCLLPVSRKKIAHYIIEHHLIQAAGFGANGSTKSNVLEGEFRREDE